MSSPGSLARSLAVLAVAFGPAVALLYFFVPWKVTLLVGLAYAAHGLSNASKALDTPLTIVSAGVFLTLVRYCWIWLRDGWLAGWAALPQGVVGAAGGLALAGLAMAVGSVVLMHLLERLVLVFNLLRRRPADG